VPLDVRTAQTELEDLLRDSILYALGYRLAAVASVEALRQVVTQGASGHQYNDDALINIVVDDAVTIAYRWSSSSSSADDGVDVIKPDDVSGSDLRLAPDVGGSSYYLHELQTGPLRRVIVLDRDTAQDEMLALLGGAVPAVMIDAGSDEPKDLVLATGHRWENRYRFRIYTLANNLRDRRQAAQGSDEDDEYGANTIDGLIWSLIGGTQLYLECDSIKNVEVGRGSNWVSDLAQRRVFRLREYTIVTTIENPAATNDSATAEQLDIQQQMADLNEQDEADPDNFVQSGINAALGVGLSKTIAAGVAYLDGTAITYVGQLYTFLASSDTYLDLKANGALTIHAVGNDAEAPAATAGALRVGKAITDGDGVIDWVYIAATKRNYPETA
jgi:hypothetical protein